MDFVNHNNHRTSRQVGTLKAAEQAKIQIEARLTLGEWVADEEKPSPTLKDYYENTLKPVWESSLSGILFEL